MADKQQGNQPQKINIKTDSFLGSLYAQIVGVSVTDIDITLEFVYKHPNSEIKEAQVITRVTLPRSAGTQLSNAILNTIKLHDEKKKREKNGK